MFSPNNPAEPTADNSSNLNTPATKSYLASSSSITSDETQQSITPPIAGVPSPYSDLDGEAANMIIAFLREYGSYVSVARALVFLEGYTERLFIDGLTNLRDVLDHLIRAARPDLDARVVAHHITEAREHLRRAGVNPLQDAVNEKFEIIDSQLRFYPIKQAIFSDIAPMREIRKGLREATDKLIEARLLKGDSAQLDSALALLRECLLGLDNLSEAMKPSAASWVVRTILYLAGATAFLFLGILVRSWWLVP